MGEKIKLTDQLAREISREYGIYQKVLAGVLLPFAQMRATQDEIKNIRAKVQEIIRRLDVLAVRWAKTAIDNAYRSKRSDIASIAKRASVFPEGHETNPGRRPVDLIEKAAADFVGVNRSIATTVQRFLSAYEQAMAGASVAKVNAQFMNAKMEAEVSRKVDYYLARGYDEGSISRKLRAYLEKLVDGKDFIEINGRFYNLKDFAEQLARTELHEAYVEATLDECRKWDCDLVQFSRHDSPCDHCGPLEGMVFSISGDDPDFPSLNDTVTVDTDKGPVEVDPKAPHSNCEHNLNPVTRAILEAAGEL
jgi:hypothetical protein